MEPSYFTQYAEDIIGKVNTEILVPMKEVDAFTFITSTEFLCEDPFPAQSIIIKTLYGLWPLYPPDNEEQHLLKILELKWHIKINLERSDQTDPVMFFILSLGRRSAKSTISSFITTFSAYRLICKGNPQLHYGIRERHAIHITHVAAKADQATSVFALTSDNLKRVTFFRPYIDFDKDNTTELRLFTPHDNLLNKQIRLRNAQVTRGTMKESTLPGSILVKSITTSAATNRGDATYCLIFSELAHVQRAKFDQSKSEDQVMEENPQTDYAIWKALTPAVKDFGADGKVIAESSPAEKGGEFYHQYCVAGGFEQEHPEDIIIEPNYAVLQLATWEARPSLPEETFAGDFRRDPRGANSEYGAHFSNPSGQFINEAIIAAIPQPGFPMILTNPGTWRFVITLDPGGKAKSKKDDCYALSWGHTEAPPGASEEQYTYWIDGMMGWNATIKSLGGGQHEKIPVDPNMVVQYVIDLANDLGGRNYIIEIGYDQWNCLRSDTLIDTNYGLVTLEQINQEFNTKEFYIHFKNKKYKIKKIVSNGVRPVYNLTTKFGFENFATEKHRFKVRKELDNKGKWGCVKDLKEKVSKIKCEIVNTPLWAEHNPTISNFNVISSPNTRKDITIPKTVTRDLGKFLGYMISEGYFYEKQATIYFTNSNKEILNDFTNSLEGLFKVKGTYHEGKEAGCSFLTVSSQNILHFLEFLGYKNYSKQKVVPWVILQSKKEIVIEFLRAYYEGDGWSGINSGDLVVGAVSKSKGLLQQIQILLTKVGIIASLHNDVKLEGTNKCDKPIIMWILLIRGKGINIFKKEIGFVSSIKRKQLDTCVSNIPEVNQQTKRYFREDNIYLDRLVHVGEHENCEVFDIEVDDESCEFSANAFVSHNSQSNISTLQSLGFPAVETTFTNPYKGLMYGNFLAKAQLGQVKMYGIDVGGWVERWKLEMKYLQQDISGKTVFYHHPQSGPVQNDDFADVTANNIYRQILRVMPTAETMHKASLRGQQIGIFTPQIRSSFSPVRGPSLKGRPGGDKGRFGR